MAYLRRFSLFIAGLGLLIIGFSSSSSSEPYFAELRNSSETTPKLFKNTQVNYYAEKLEALTIKLRPGTEHRKDSRPTKRSSSRCKAAVYQTLIQLPSSHRNQLKQLTLFYSSDGRRGLGGNGSVILRCLNVTDTELASVLIHEMGHIVDADFLKGSEEASKSGFYDFDTPIALDDKSLLFYQVSWESESQLKPEVSSLDFVSLYAMTNPFEDFAETYTYYRLHGPSFRKLIESSAALREKYEFMKRMVFEEKEFGATETPVNLDIFERHYDVTVLPFPLLSFTLS